MTTPNAGKCIFMFSNDSKRRISFCFVYHAPATDNRRDWRIRRVVGWLRRTTANISLPSHIFIKPVA